MLSDTSLEALRFNALLQQLYLILVVGLNGIYHELVLMLLFVLVLFELSLLLQKLVLLELTGKLVDLLAKHDLLSIALVIEGLLMREEFIVELALANSLNAGFPL